MDAIQVFNDSLPIIVQSGLAIKLLDSVNSVASALYGPRLVFRNGKAEVDVEAYRREKLGEGYLEFTRSEAFFLHNFYSAFAYAAEQLDGDECSDEPTSAQEASSPEFDWMMRFFDAASRVTNVDLQQLWGKILANETREQGRFSLRTLDIVRNLSHGEAMTFDLLCRHVMLSGSMLFVFDNGFCELEYLDDGSAYNERSRSIVAASGLNDQDDIQPLVEAGLLTKDHRFAGTFREKKPLVMGNTSVSCIVKPDPEHTMIVFDPYLLTKSGSELFRAIASGSGFRQEQEYNAACLGELRTMYPNHDWMVFAKDGKGGYEVLDV